tara:strand:- start:193 stop:1233 length:1041 start_codon:yes stop_codon:yes gene_type:complete
MSLDMDFLIYPRSEDFLAEKTFLDLTRKLENSVFTEHSWLVFTITNELPSSSKEYRIEKSQSHEDRKSASELYRKKYELDKSNCLQYQAFTWLDRWRISEESNRPEKSPVQLYATAWDKGHYRGNGFRYNGHAQLFISPANSYFMRLDQGDLLQPDVNYAQYNECVKKNLDILRDILALVIEAVDPLSVKIFTDNGTYLPYNSHATYFANPEAFINDLHMINDYWIGNFDPYFQGEPRPFKDCDPIKHKFKFSEMRPEEQRIELWEMYDDYLQMLDLVTPEVVNLAWDVEQSTEEGGLDIQRTDNGGAFVFGSKDFFNSYVSDIYLYALEIAYHIEKKKEEDSTFL